MGEGCDFGDLGRGSWRAGPVSGKPKMTCGALRISRPEGGKRRSASREVLGARGAFERVFRLDSELFFYLQKWSVLRLRASEGFYIEQDKAQAILLSGTHSAS
jgi:hypothetical protein